MFSGDDGARDDRLGGSFRLGGVLEGTARMRQEKGVFVKRRPRITMYVALGGLSHFC